MRYRYLVIVITVMFLLAGILVPMSVAQDQPAFTIGVLDNPEQSISQGAQLAVQRFNQFGGVRGADGTLFRLELVVEPFDPQTLSDTVTRFTEQGVIAVLGPDSGEALVEILPQLQTLNVPIFAPATTDALLSQDTTGLVWRTLARDLEQARSLAGYLVSDLSLQGIATVQLDPLPQTQVNALNFANATAALGVTPVTDIQLADAESLEAAISQITGFSPDAVVVFGAPEQAAAFHDALRAAGFAGYFGYGQASDPVFHQAIPGSQLPAVLTSSSWSIASEDDRSNAFVLDYARTFDTLPDAVAVANYDAVQMIAQAISIGGEFQATLDSLSGFEGVQGLLKTDDLEARETSNNTVVLSFNDLGGSQAVAHYAGTVRLPESVFLTVTSQVQNVRVGPSTDFEILGQLEQGERVPIVGTNVDKTWVVVDFRGQQGWMAAYLLDIRGNLDSTPLIEEPVLPTVVPQEATPADAVAEPTVAAAATAEADIVIDNAVVNPYPIVPNQPFTLTVTLRNAGLTDAGEFAVAATLPPNDVFTSVIIPNLPAGQSVNTDLTGTLVNTGVFSVEIVTDLNNQVVENELGESNNTYFFNYLINQNIIEQDTVVLNPGDMINLEGDSIPEDQRQDDVTWDGNMLSAVGGARLGIISPGNDGFDWLNTGIDEANEIYWNLTNPDVVDRIQWDLIDPNTVINVPQLDRNSLNPGTLVGVITSEGRRSVIRLDELPETNQMDVTYLVYQQ